jgi:hypothetical protein
MIARSLLALVALALFVATLSCSPAANQKLVTEGKEAAECLASPPVQECMKGLACSGPEKQCALGLAAYRASCLELCKRGPGDAGAD